MKVVAYGFWHGPNCYLSDGWNWMDFIVVVTGLFGIIAKSVGVNFDFLRVFRVMRPLRSLTVVPEMKKIVNTVIMSIPKLGSVLSMGMFLMTIFGILALNLFTGVFFRSCRASPIPTYQFEGNCFTFDKHPDAEDRLCGGAYHCGPAWQLDPVTGPHLPWAENGHAVDTSSGLPAMAWADCLPADVAMRLHDTDDCVAHAKGIHGYCRSTFQ